MRVNDVKNLLARLIANAIRRGTLVNVSFRVAQLGSIDWQSGVGVRVPLALSFNTHSTSMGVL